MINEILTCARPEGLMQEEALADQRRHAPAWRANRDFVRKAWLYGGEGRRGGAARARCRLD